jgi:hypothetical protein
MGKLDLRNSKMNVITIILSANAVGASSSLLNRRSKNFRKKLLSDLGLWQQPIRWRSTAFAKTAERAKVLVQSASDR